MLTSSPGTILELCIAGVVAIGIIAATTAFIFVGKAAFAATTPESADSLGLLFRALPALLTVALIVVATAVLTAYHYIGENGCVAIFSSIASFVLGAEAQKGRGSTRPRVPVAADPVSREPRA